MTEVEELQAEIDVLTFRLNACEEVIMSITDGLGQMLEVTGIVKRFDLAHSLLRSVRARRIGGDGSAVELDLIEAAANRLLKPSSATVIVHDDLTMGSC